MANSIKSPQEETFRKGSTAPSGSGEKNGEPGYKKRTPGHSGPDEVTYSGAKPKANLDIKTPSSDITKK